jgi:hypothetical protein
MQKLIERHDEPQTEYPSFDHLPLPSRSPDLFNDTLTVSDQRRFGRKQQRLMHCKLQQ